MVDILQLQTPSYVLEETLLRRNLATILSIKEQASVDIILAFKAFSLWRTFPIIREYIGYSTASSAFEALLAKNEMKSLAHTYSPAYTEQDFPTILACSSHITFNSLSQFARFYPQVKSYECAISCGIRINPEYSTVETDLYNPCAPGSRLGITSNLLSETLPDGVDGFHFHCLCESDSYALEQALTHVEEKFGKFLPQLKWLNMGGGHLMTRSDYDTKHLIAVLKTFNTKYPNLRLILEPGSAFAWQTGYLQASVVDIVANHGIQTAILDISFTCHMPDCLEMPYKPTVRNASEPIEGKPTYRLGGNSCLSGDFMGDWSFDAPLKVGDPIIFEDMIHYTIVKTSMFNGIKHPDIVLHKTNGEAELLRSFEYEDYKHRMG